MDHILEILHLLPDFSQFIAALKGVGKSFTSYFITCLLIGVHRNYAQCLEAENSKEIQLWQQTKVARLLTRFPIYASNPMGVRGTFAEIIIFCQKF